MTFTEAMQAVQDGKAVYSPTLNGTVVRMNGQGRTMFVPRIVNGKPIIGLVEFDPTHTPQRPDDWILSGVELATPA